MDQNTLIKRNEELLSSEMDDELVMMNLENNNYFGLNKIGKDIWEQLDEPITLENLCKSLTQKYDVSFEQCKNDVSIFIDKLVEVNIVETT